MQHTNERTKRLSQKGSTHARDTEELGHQAPERTTAPNGERTDPENDHKRPEQAPEMFSCATALAFTSVQRQIGQRRLRRHTAPTYLISARREAKFWKTTRGGTRGDQRYRHTSHCSRQRLCGGTRVHTRFIFLHVVFCLRRPPCQRHRLFLRVRV